MLSTVLSFGICKLDTNGKHIKVVAVCRVFIFLGKFTYMTLDSYLYNILGDDSCWRKKRQMERELAILKSVIKDSDLGRREDDELYSDLGAEEQYPDR